VRRLDLVVGPNGAGKTTFVTTVLAPLLPEGTVFVNADIIASREWPDDPMAHSYDAALVAAELRSLCLGDGRSFVAETVFSHESKLELVAEGHANGFEVVLHVLMIPEDLAVLRVAQRVATGGHDVPEEKIRTRWQRLWPNVVAAAHEADDTSFYDNTSLRGPTLVGRLERGIPVIAMHWPPWAHTSLTTAWP
jgi:predicted ABC-type ATPase